MVGWIQRSLKIFPSSSWSAIYVEKRWWQHWVWIIAHRNKSRKAWRCLSRIVLWMKNEPFEGSERNNEEKVEYYMIRKGQGSLMYCLLLLYLPISTSILQIIIIYGRQEPCDAGQAVPALPLEVWLYPYVLGAPILEVSLSISKSTRKCGMLFRSKIVTDVGGVEINLSRNVSSTSKTSCCLQQSWRLKTVIRLSQLPLPSSSWRRAAWRCNKAWTWHTRSSRWIWLMWQR